ncbi:hypothetical protein MK280_18210, partial [Myxococcota bacterium]|nr:hypothetical protein [Myxococcota bacterium]
VKRDLLIAGCREDVDSSPRATVRRHCFAGLADALSALLGPMHQAGFMQALVLQNRDDIPPRKARKIKPCSSAWPDRFGGWTSTLRA